MGSNHPAPGMWGLPARVLLTSATGEEDFGDRFDALDRRLDAFERRMDERFEAVDQRFATISERFEAMNRRFESVEKRQAAMDEKLSRQFRWLVGGQVTVLVTVVGALVAALFPG